MNAAAKSGKRHEFGGDWTSAKLEILRKYLAAYLQALKNQPFRKAYIDAFAGTGYRSHREAKSPKSKLLFPEFAQSDPQALLDGSARIALQVTPSFDRYIFIERNAERAAQLDELRQEFPDHASKISVRTGDANAEIRDLCEKKWAKHRAVLFLDPYGMQVDWTTVEAIAATKAIDMWLLFPIGIGVNRLLKRSGDIPESWRAALDRLLGTSDWFDEFYAVETAINIFGDEEQHVTKRSIESIGKFFNARLKSIFAGVAQTPAVLRNSKGSPLYLLCFAAGNPIGAPVAVRIANNLLKGV